MISGEEERQCVKRFDEMAGRGEDKRREGKKRDKEVLRLQRGKTEIYNPAVET